MQNLDQIIAELKSLPPDEQAQAAEFIHRLKARRQAQRHEVLARTAGCLSDPEAEEWARAIEAGCEVIRPQDWDHADRHDQGD